MAGMARPGVSLPFAIRAALLRPARALPPFSLLCLGTLPPVTSQTPAAAPAGSPPHGLLFRHIFVPQALKLLQKGAHHVSTQTRKGITLRSAQGLGRSEVSAAGQWAVLTQGTAPLCRVLRREKTTASSFWKFECTAALPEDGGYPLPHLLAVALILGHLWWGSRGPDQEGQSWREPPWGPPPGR